MANTYTWKVGQCNRNLSDGMISTLHYTVNAATEDGVYSVGAHGSVGLEAAELKSMIAYDDVTEEQAIGWAQAAIGGADKVSKIHASLDNELTEKRTPTTGTGLPWSA
tara:strand:- start:110 stop:433 length:324 start_codon:yes stop_codon:yes gene_type:complete